MIERNDLLWISERTGSVSAAGLLILALSLAAAASVRGSDAADSVSRKIDALFADWDGQDRPGCAVAIVKNGKVLHARGYGMADLEHGVPIRPDTVFDTASVSKQFTGMAIAMLVKEGKLSLEDDIRKHLPEMPDFGRTITVAHLVHHTGGLRDWPMLFGFQGRRMEDAITFEDILRLARRQRELNFEPGAEYSYTNTGYNLLARIVEQVTGKPFAEWTREHIFGPLGMADTHFCDDHRRLIPRRANSYHRGSDGGFRNAGDQLAAVGSSSLYSTVEDLAKWLTNFETGAVGGSEVLAMMHQRGMLNDGSEIDYAFGLVVGSEAGMKKVWHTGSWAGFRTITVHYPEEKVGIVLLSNRGDSDASAVAERIARILMPEKFAAEPEVDAVLSEERVERPILERLAGDYVTAHGVVMRIEEREGRLIRTAPGRARELRPIGRLEFRLADSQDRYAFQTDDKGNPGGFVISWSSGRISADRFTHVPPSGAEEYAGRYYSEELDVPCEVAVKGGELTLQLRVWGEERETRLLASRKDAFACPGVDCLVEFVRGDDGRVNTLLLTQPRNRRLRFTRVDVPETVPVASANARE